MTKDELKVQCQKIAVELTKVCFPGQLQVDVERLMDGKLSNDEKLANLEVWETFKVFTAGCAGMLLPENESNYGFDKLLSEQPVAPPPDTSVPNPTA